MLQRTFNQQTVTALFAMANMAGVKIPGSVQIPLHPTGQALLSLLHYRQDGAQHVPFREVK